MQNDLLLEQAWQSINSCCPVDICIYAHEIKDIKNKLNEATFNNAKAFLYTTGYDMLSSRTKRSLIPGLGSIKRAIYGLTDEATEKPIFTMLEKFENKTTKLAALVNKRNENPFKKF